MASCDWMKFHGATESKAVLRHNDRQKRKEDLHSNPDIDKTMTDSNLDILDRTYKEKCVVYDSKVKALEKNVKRLKKDRVTMIGIEIPIPNEIPDDQVELFTKLSFGAVGDLVGYENIISVDTHNDEQHTYIDSKTKQERMSMRHIHISCVPGVDGALNGKQFVTRARMIDLNNEIENICQNEFGCQFLTGEGTKSKDSVEALKMKSKKAELEVMAEKVAEREKAVQKTRDLNAKESKKLFEERKQLEAEKQAFELEKSGTRKKLAGEIRKAQAEQEGWRAARKVVYDASSFLNEQARKQTLEKIDEEAQQAYKKKIAEAMTKGDAVHGVDANSYDRSIV